MNLLGFITYRSCLRAAFDLSRYALKNSCAKKSTLRHPVHSKRKSS